MNNIILSSNDKDWIKIIPLCDVMIDNAIERIGYVYINYESIHSYNRKVKEDGTVLVKFVLQDIHTYYYDLAVKLLKMSKHSTKITIMNETHKIGEPVYKKELNQKDSWQGYLSSGLVLLNELIEKLKKAIKYKKSFTKQAINNILEISKMYYEDIESIVDENTTENTVKLANDIIENIENKKL